MKKLMTLTLALGLFAATPFVPVAHCCDVAPKKDKNTTIKDVTSTTMPKYMNDAFEAMLVKSDSLAKNLKGKVKIINGTMTSSYFGCGKSGHRGQTYTFHGAYLDGPMKGKKVRIKLSEGASWFRSRRRSNLSVDHGATVFNTIRPEKCDIGKFRGSVVRTKKLEGKVLTFAANLLNQIQKIDQARKMLMEIKNKKDGAKGTPGEAPKVLKIGQNSPSPMIVQTVSHSTKGEYLLKGIKTGKKNRPFVVTINPKKSAPLVSLDGKKI